MASNIAPIKRRLTSLALASRVLCLASKRFPVTFANNNIQESLINARRNTKSLNDFLNEEENSPKEIATSVKKERKKYRMFNSDIKESAICNLKFQEKNSDDENDNDPTPKFPSLDSDDSSSEFKPVALFKPFTEINHAHTHIH